jgi:hypothetical protein
MFYEPRLRWPRRRAFALVAATLIVFTFATTNVVSANSAQFVARNAALLSTKIGTASPSAIVVRIAGPKTIDDSSRTAGGITVYLGVVPAAQVKGQGVGMMHGGPKGPHDYHIVAAVFDAATGARISDATVTAKVSGLTLSGTETRLEPMDIANTITYGGFVRLPGADLYAIRLTIQRPAVDRSVVLEFKYDHR